MPRLSYAARLLAACMAAFAVVLASTGAGFAASEYVIVAAEPAAEAFPLGKVLRPGDRLDVPAGSMVTLIGEDGSVQAIAGPTAVIVTDDGTTTTGASANPDGRDRSSTLKKIAGLIAGDQKAEEALGASRVLGPATGLSDPWGVATGTSGAACIRGDRVVLVREAGGPEVPLTVRAGDRPALDGAIWAAGDTDFALPTPLPAGEDRLTVQVGGKAAEVTVHRLPSETGANPVDVIGWMLDQGCERQALLFARQLAPGAR